MGFQLGAKEQAIAKAREKAANVWAAIFFPILTIIFGFNIGYGYHLAIFADDGFEEYRNLVLATNGITIIFVFIFSCLIALTWNEPEIIALHKGFILFFAFFAYAVPIARIVALEAPVTPMPDGTGLEKFRWGCFVFLQCFANQCSLIGCLVIRQRVFYEIYHNYNLNPSFWVGVPIYVLVCISIAVPFIACSYTGVCTLGVMYSVFYSMMIIMAAIFAYYLYYTAEASKCFVQFWANIRAFVLHNLVQVLFFSFILSEAANVGTLEVLTSPYFVWLIILDTFALPMLKACARKFFGINLFTNVDVLGAPYRAMNNREQFYANVVDKALYPEFQRYADSMFAGENVKFLHEFYTLKGEEEDHCTREYLKDKIDRIMEKYVTDDCSKDQINISDAIKVKMLKVHLEDSWVVVDDLFGKAENAISTDILLGIWGSYKNTDAYEKTIKSCIQSEGTFQSIGKSGYSTGTKENSLYSENRGSTLAPASDDALNYDSSDTLNNIGVFPTVDEDIINEV